MALPKFDHIFQILPAPSVILLPNAEFTIVAANNKLLRLFNSSNKEIIGRGILGAISESFPDNHKNQAVNNLTSLKNSLERVIATKEPHKISNQQHFLPIPGSSEFEIKYINVLSTPVLDDHHTLTHILHTIEDVTEERTFEKAYESEKQRFLDLYEQAPSCMAVFKGPNHIYEMANPLLLRVNGKKKIIGKAAKEVSPELEEQGLIASMDKVYKTGKAFSANEALIKFDIHGTGKLVDSYFDFTYQPHRDKNGEIDGVFLFAVEVTEQVLARKKIEKSEKRYLELMQNLPVATYSCDRDGRILFYNEAVADLWGTAPEIGKKMWCDSWKLYSTSGTFLTPDLCPMAVALKEGIKVGGHEMILERQNGEKRNILAYAVPFIDESGQVTGGVNMLIDITEKKEAQIALEKSEKKYRQIVETAQEGILIVDKEQKTSFANKKMCEILEVSREEIIGKNILSLMDGEGKDQAEKLLVKKKNFLDQIEFKYITKSGKEVWTRSTANPLFNEEGVFQGNLAMVTDITENKKAEEKLIQSEKRLKEAQEIANFGGYEYDITTEEFLFSEETCRIYGLKPEEKMISKSDWLSLIHPEDLEDFLSVISSAEKTLDDVNYEHRLLLKDGTVKYLLGKSRYHLDHQGNPKNVHGICQDITEIKKTEEKIIQSEKRLKEAQEIAKFGSWEFDPSTEELILSEEACRIYGIPPQDNRITIEYLQSFVHPEDYEEFTIEMEESTKALRESVYNHRIILKDGSVKHLHGKAKFEFDSHGEPNGVFGITQDVTELRKAEIDLQHQNKELLKANKELDRFVYSASHDLRSPLTSIMGLTSFIEEESKEAETLEHIKMIRTSINRLDGFIKNILSYSQNNRTMLEVEQISLNKNIQEVVDSLCSMEEAKKINFEIEVLEQQAFYSDLQRFNTVLENLISNAIKYHCKDKSNQYIKIEATSDKEKLKLIISDNGIGIAPLHHAKIFDMFYRLSGRPNGSGIGLYIVKDTIEKLQGSIQIQSEEGTGATFIIVLKNLKA